MNDSALGIIADHLHSIAALHSRVLAQVDRRLRECGYAEPERRVLRGLLSAADCTDRDLGLRVAMGPPQLSRTLTQLFEQKLVTATRSPQRRNQRFLSLTSEGRETARELDSRAKAAFALEFDELTPNEQDILNKASVAASVRRGKPRAGGKLQLRKPKGTDWGSIIAKAGQLAESELKWREPFIAYVADAVSCNIEQSGQDISPMAWVATIDNQRVGACLMTYGTDPIHSNEDSLGGTISLLIVDPESRGRGIGRRLVQECVTAAREMTLRSLSMEASSSQKALIGLLKATGFKQLRGTRSDTRYGPLEEWADYMLKIVPLRATSSD